MSKAKSERRLFDEISSGDIAAIRDLISADRQLLRQTSALGSCLHMAARIGSTHAVEELVDLGADIDLVAELGGPPVTVAAGKGHLEVVKRLVAKSALLDFHEADQNPLFAAIDGGHPDVAKFLLKSGINANVVYRGTSGKLKNALSYAHEYRVEEIVQLLLEAGCKLPIEGVDIPVNKGENSSVAEEGDSSRDQLVSFVRDLLGPVDESSLQEIVPVHDEVHVAINVVHATDESPMTTLFTTGMSDRAMSVPQGHEEFQHAELVMHLPPDWPLDLGDESSAWPMQWLRQIAYYPHQASTWFGGPHTIISSDDPPAPLGPNTQQTCLLLLADFPPFAPITLTDGRNIKFYTVIPLYTDERDFEVQYGMQALMDRFQEAAMSPVVDPDRKRVV